MGGFGAIEAPKNLAIVAVIVAIAAPIARLLRRRPGSPRRAAADPLVSDGS
jgi:hypothetical protein